MWTIYAKDLPTLSEDDQGLICNLFAAKSGISLFRKNGLIFGLGGLVATAAAFGGLHLNPALPDEPLLLALTMEALPLLSLLFTACTAGSCFWKSKRSSDEARKVSRELQSRGIDASNLSSDQVFEGVVLPMLRRSGLKIRE